jgi:predicted MFS family arabinose efflux permease
VALSEIQARTGVSTANLGAAAAVDAAVVLTAQLFVVPHIDRGHARKLLAAALACGAVGVVVLSYAWSLASLVLARALIAAAVGVVIPAVYGIVASTGTPRRGRVLALTSAIHSVGTISGAFLSAVLFNVVGVTSALRVFGLVAAAVACAAAFALPDSASDQSNPKLPFDLLRSPSTQAAIMFSVACTLPYGLYTALWDRFVTDHAGSVDANMLNGFTYLLAGVPYILFTSLGGRLADSGRERIFAFVAVVSVALTAFGYAVSRDPASILTMSFIDGATQGLLDPVVLVLVAASVPAARSASAQSLAAAAASVAALVVGGVSPWVYARFGSFAAFAGVGVCVAAVGTAAVLKSRSAGHL